ncbi:MAG: glycosyltransferase family 2 protein [Fidelibacterota bacterium]
MNVSVIVSIYNGADILPVTIPPLLCQDYPRELTEIILVDDASTDGTPTLLDNPPWRERCHVIRHPENRGRCATRNSGMAAATGDLLIFMDCDIEVGPTFISKHVHRHGDKDTIGVLSNLHTREFPPKDKYHRYLFEGKRGARQVGEHEPLPFKYFIMTSSSIKSFATRQTGPFNENLPAYGIDLEYSYRLWQNFPKGLFYAPDIVVYMHQLKSLREALSDFREYGRRNLPIILARNPELAPYLGADFVRIPHGKVSLKILAGALFMNPVMARLAQLLLPLTPYPLSNFLIRYLMVCSVASGYRQSVPSHE